MNTAFMPRPTNMNQELVDRCAEANICVIDPTLSDEMVTAAIKNCDLLLTESLYGAMTADQLRIPWISIYADRGHERNWRQWCATKNMIWNPIDMVQYTLSWARDFAVPQLSALGTHQ